MLKKLLPIFALFAFLVLPKSASAFSAQTFVTISNPVRGYEGWTNTTQTPLDVPKFQYQESTASAFPVTWLLRYDAVSNATISAYFKDLISKDTHESLGAFLEITPSLTAQAGVAYPEGLSIFNANHIFLSGYSQKDRLLLIDTYMNTFFTRYGFYPQSVAAWQLDSYSLQYLQSKYSVLTAMNCDDQYSMDSYRLWGGYLGSPYFPDKDNSLVPADSLKNRVNLAMVRWAQRDLFNFYGTGTASLYSVQLNDYLALGQKTTYFDSLLSMYKPNGFNEFTYVNVGLENDYSLPFYRQEITNVYHSLKADQDKDNLRFISLSGFGDWFRSHYPESSPTYFYRTTDPTDSQKGEVFWYQSSHYRIGLKAVAGQTKIIDFRVYNRNIYEENYATPNQNTSLYTEIPAVIDSVKYPGTELSFDIDLSQFQTTYDKQWDLWQMTLTHGNQKITFLPNAITFTNISAPTIKSPDIKISSTKSETTWTTNPQVPLQDYYRYSWIFWLLLVAIIILFLKKLLKKGKPKTPFSLVIGLVCVLAICLTVFRNSLDFPFGMAFFGPNGHDAVFHLSLIEKFAQNPFNFAHPQYAGAILSNYHFVFDYFSGVLSKIFSIPAATLYFRFLPLIFGVTLVFLLQKLMTKWSYSPFEKTLGYLLVFLSGSFGFIPKIFSGQEIFSGESTFWANQSASLFLNPPFVLSLIFLIIFLLNFPEDKKIRPLQFIKLAFLGGLLAQTKVYSFVLLLGGLFLSGQFGLMFAVGTFGGLISLPFSSLSGSPFSFNPLWFPKSLFASFDRLYWPRFVQAWQSYEASGNFPKLLAVNVFALITFLVGNLGMRILGLFHMAKAKPVSISQKIVYGIIIVGLLLPLVIVQNDNPWNTIQFMYYSLFFLSLLTARVIVRLSLSIKNLFLRIIFLVIILSLATLTSVGTLKDYVGNSSPARVSFTEMQALAVLKGEPNGIVLSPLYTQNNQIAVPKPLYAYVSSAYISALSGQSEFMSDTINLDITGFNYQGRSRDIQRFYSTKDSVWAKSFLEKNRIKYIYETPLQKMQLSSTDLSLTKIFDSGEINIYQTN
jgi:hypothetical protein